MIIWCLEKNINARKFYERMGGKLIENQKYFEKGGILIPCIDVEFESDALKGIGISPTLDFETTKSSIYRATEINFPQIKENKDSVYPSKIPVRY